MPVTSQAKTRTVPKTGRVDFIMVTASFGAQNVIFSVCGADNGRHGKWAADGSFFIFLNMFIYILVENTFETRRFLSDRAFLRAWPNPRLSRRDHAKHDQHMRIRRGPPGVAASKHVIRAPFAVVVPPCSDIEHDALDREQQWLAWIAAIVELQPVQQVL